ncbi:MAG: SlyX protein [Rhodospirillales bacterium]|nr:SlyX protein [Rhodospirillales bacterium]
MTELETLTARIDGLEVRIAHQDQTIEDLNATITEHWKQIEDLTYRLSRLGEQLREVESSAGVREGPEPLPPHY